MLWKGGRKSDNVEDLRGSGMGRNVAASAIGDDRLQKQSKGYIVPDSFTHGSSAQRVRWFKRGIESGNISACDTFNARAL